MKKIDKYESGDMGDRIVMGVESFDLYMDGKKYDFNNSLSTSLLCTPSEIENIGDSCREAITRLNEFGFPKEHMKYGSLILPKPGDVITEPLLTSVNFIELNYPLFFLPKDLPEEVMREYQVSKKSHNYITVDVNYRNLKKHSLEGVVEFVIGRTFGVFGTRAHEGESIKKKLQPVEIMRDPKLQSLVDSVLSENKS